jgi:uncharacterized membrane protein
MARNGECQTLRVGCTLMDDEAIHRLAELVAARVFEPMAEFIEALEKLVRQNEMLRGRVDQLEAMLADEISAVTDAWPRSRAGNDPTFD